MAARRSKQEPDVEITGNLIHETEKALLLFLEDRDEEKWFPLRVINEREDSSTYGVTIKVQHWFALKEGLI